MSTQEDLEEQFSAAADWVAGAISSGSVQFTDDSKLQFYGLYKQATAGPCTQAKPAFWNRAARLKWDAWNSRRDLSATDAMQQYVSLLSSLAPQWEDAGGSQEGQAGTSKAAGDSQQESRKGGGFGPVFSTFAQEYDADGSQQGSDMDQGAPNIHEFASQGDEAALLDILETGEPIDQRDPQGCTALHFAADRGHTHIASLLIARGADVNAVNEDGSSPLHYAALCGHEKVAEVLLDAGADASIQDSSGETARDIAPSTWQCWR